MDLKQLKAAGGFVSSKPKKVTKEWKTPDGEKVDIDFYIVPQSFGNVEQLYLSWAEEGKSKSRSSEMISEFIRLGEDASEKISYEEAYCLHESLAEVFLTAIMEDRSPKKATAKRSKTKSGTSSSSQA